MSRSVLILGAHSAIAMATARRFAAEGWTLHLALRGPSRLQADRDDIAIRLGVEVTLHDYNALDPDAIDEVMADLPALPDVVVCAVGLLGEQETAQRDADFATLILRSNFEGPALHLERLAGRFEARGSGRIVGVSSVAGERGRASNYVYGAAKSGFTAFLSGLRNRLHGTGVGVTTVLPGFVDTPMVAGRDLPPALTAQPEDVARAIFAAVEAERDVIYVKRRWRWIMAVVRALPEPVFKRTRF
ncbi:SDR family oxidoreductase [Palleronia abyssalis]|uniref:Putative oxidoreductase n=1 Tax=Palleronia abyssalis TaxID=1501240 RepID=A0A2R8C0I9_9RHOB|nr:SDR family oxidoreductase [Palleronia abyssalis]SPJ25892.1 putative oxidoreductase [Palleronia abyssalis]